MYKKAIITLGIAMVFLLAAFNLSFAGEKTANIIKIGSLAPKAGHYALYGESALAVDYVVEQINKAGGIKSMGGAKLQVVHASPESPDQMAGELERLVLKEKVKAIIATTPTTFAFAGATVYDRLKVPVITAIATSEPLFALNLEYWRMISLPSSQWALMLRAAKEMMDAGVLPPIKRIAIVGSDAVTYNIFRKSELKLLKEYGWENKVVADVKFGEKAADYTAAVLKVKVSNPDIIIGNFDIHMGKWLKACHEQAYEMPPFFGAGILFSSWRGKGFVGEDLFQAHMNNKPFFGGRFFHVDIPGPGIQAFTKGFGPWIKAKGLKIDDLHAPPAQAAYALVRALEKAGTADPKVINTTLKTLEIPTGDLYLITPMFAPALKWLPNGSVANIVVPVGQWINGKGEIVWPPSMATAKPIL